MYSEDHARYVLLTNNNNRNSWLVADKKTLILVAAITLPVILFCGTYMTLFGVYEKVVYPTTHTLEVSDISLQHAIQYNSVNATDDNDYNFVHVVKNFSENNTYKLVCYYSFPNKEIYALKAYNVDPYLCTHIIAGFATLVNNSIVLEDYQLFMLKKLVALKLTNRDLKVMITVGGAGNNGGFAEMVLNHSNRKSFIKSVLEHVKTYNIDGIDLDWEYPNQDKNKDNKQRVHFTQLLEEIRAEINRQVKYKFLLSVAVAAPVILVDSSYDVNYMNEYVDFVNLMSYDYHFYTRFTPFTGINSPLYAGNSEKFYLSTLNINYTVNYWNYKGMDKNKIIVGLPTYGHSFKLTNPRNNGLYAPTTGYGKLGSKGFIDYSQVCVFLSLNHISPVFDMDTKSPYASKYTEWISFDDEQSLSYKAEFVRDNHFGGVMVYSLNSDDHQGLCASTGKLSKVKFPLINKIKEVLSERPT